MVARRALTAALALLTALPLLGLGALHAAPSAAAMTPTYWQNQFIACADGNFVDSVLMAQPAQDCMEEVFYASIMANDTVDMHKGLANQIKATPNLFMWCHPTAHLAGRKAVTSLETFEKYFLANASNTCQYGLGHGLLDGLVKLKLTVEEFARPVEVCEKAVSDPTTGQMYINCGDGIGHAAFATMLDLKQASLVCGHFKADHLRAHCADGIVMQAYEPSADAFTYETSSAPQRLPIECTQWPGDDIGLLEGCNRGAGYIYTRAAWWRQDAWYRENNDIVMTREVAEEIGQLMHTAVDQCQAHHGKDAIRFCIKGIAWRTPTGLYDHPDIMEGLCARQGEWQDFCLNQHEPQ